MPQSRNTALLGHQNEERKNEDKANAAYETKDAQRTATEEPVCVGEGGLNFACYMGLAPASSVYQNKYPVYPPAQNKYPV